MIEKIIFNLFAFTLFILIFIKFIRKNDTSYVYLLITQFVGIAINFIELSLGKSFGQHWTAHARWEGRAPARRDVCGIS